MQRGRVPEAWLRFLWQERRFPSPFTTTDGRQVEIRRRGSPNHDAGPDFTDAQIRIGGVLFRGDVEIHVDAGDWDLHGHDSDPHYNRVILHAACFPPGAPARTASGRTIPLLLLPLPRLADVSSLNDVPTLPCASAPPPPAPRIRFLLARLSFCRIDRKAEAQRARLDRLLTECSASTHADAGPWDQLLYEGIMEGLGYATNREPFLALARNVPLHFLRRFDLRDAELMRGILFGAAGFLKNSGAERGGAPEEELRRLRKRWRGARRRLRVPVMHEADWRFFRLRPVNFPTARLAAWSALLPRLFAGGGTRRVLEIFAAPHRTPIERHRALRELLNADVAGYWSTHYRFDDDPTRHGAAIGRARTDDIIINTLIPAALLSARVFRLHRIDEHAQALLRAFPPLQENRATVFVQRNLLRGAVRLSTAHLQQGALELYHGWCRNGRCGECPATAGLAGAGATGIPARM